MKKSGSKKNMSMQNLLLTIKVNDEPVKPCSNFTPRYDKENYNDKYLKMTQTNRSSFNKSKQDLKPYPNLASMKSISKFEVGSPRVLNQEQPKRPRILWKASRNSSSFFDQFKLRKVLGNNHPRP